MLENSLNVQPHMFVSLRELHIEIINMEENCLKERGKSK